MYMLMPAPMNHSARKANTDIAMPERPPSKCPAREHRPSKANPIPRTIAVCMFASVPGLYPGSLFLLISPDQFRMLDDMSLHCFLHILLARILQVGKDGVERIEFVKVAMAADWRTRAAVTGTFEIASSLQGAGG